MNEHTDKNDSGLEDVVGTEGQGTMHVINFLGFIKKTFRWNYTNTPSNIALFKMFCCSNRFRWNGQGAFAEGRGACI